MAAMRNRWSPAGRFRLYDRFMSRTDLPYTRTLTLVLPESEWRALRDAEPDAVGWLQGQIRNRLSSTETPPPPAAARAAEFSIEDEY